VRHAAAPARRTKVAPAGAPAARRPGGEYADPQADTQVRGHGNGYARMQASTQLHNHTNKHTIIHEEGEAW
jgi:hypothetical protein